MVLEGLVQRMAVLLRNNSKSRKILPRAIYLRLVSADCGTRLVMTTGRLNAWLVQRSYVQYCQMQFGEKHKYLLLTTKQAKCTNIYRIDGWSRLRLDVERTSRCFFIEIFLICCLKQLVHELISVSFWSTLFPKMGLFLSGKPDTLFFQADGLRWLPAWRSADFRTMV